MSRRVLDRVAAAGLLLLFGYWIFAALLRRGEWYDDIAYALPAANAVLDGTLTVPQLGPQCGFGTTWLFNAPIFAVGPIPFFLVFGPNFSALVAWLAIMALLNLVVFAVVIRRAFRLSSWSAAVFLSYAFLGSCSVLDELHNHRPTIIAMSVLCLAFIPPRTATDDDDTEEAGASRGPRPWWQWLAAGLLPLIHPALIVAGGFWIVAEIARKGVAASWSARRWGGPALWLLASLSTLAWYGRPGPFFSQFLPHFRSGNYRAGTSMMGLLVLPGSRIASLPTLASQSAVSVLALLILVVGLAPSRRTRFHLSAVLPAAGLMGVVLLLDLTRGFKYLPLYCMGLAPCLLFVCRSATSRKAACMLLGVLAAVNVVVTQRLEASFHPILGSTAQVAFLSATTRPNDRIVVGPPFVLVAAGKALPGGRTIVRVSPQPYHVDGFQPRAYFDEIAETTDVYVGEPAWFTTPMSLPSKTGPIYTSYDVTPYTLGDKAVIVARKTRPVR